MSSTEPRQPEPEPQAPVSASESPTSNLGPTAQRRQDRVRRPAAAQPIDLEALAAEQGVGPTDSIRDLRGQFWPDDELVDKFLLEIRVLRRQNGGQIIL